jgi:hypothetical protein
VQERNMVGGEKVLIMNSLRAFLVLLVLPFAVRAANVELNDGRIYSAEIISQDSERLMLNINGMKVQLPRSMIASIDENAAAPAALQKGEIAILPVTGTAPRVHGSGFAPNPPAPANPPVNVPIPATYEEVTPMSGVHMPKDPLILGRIRATIDNLRSDLAVIDSRRILQDMGDVGLLSLAEYGLYHESPIVRARAAQMLGEMGGRRALKPLIEAYYSAAKPTIEPFQVNYVETLLNQISNITGQTFHAYARAGTSAPLVADKLLEWWSQHYAELPPQIGEPRLEATNVNYSHELAVLRGLKLQHREFAGFNYPPDWIPAFPPDGMLGGYPIPPTIPRSLELERNTSTSQTPAVERYDTNQRDAPGLRRQEDYLDRMRDAVRSGTYR